MLLTPPSPAVRICFWRFQSSRHLTFWYDGSFCIHSGGPVHYSFLLKVSGGAIHMADEKKDLVEKVKQIIAEQLGVDEGEVTPSASFVTISAPIHLIRLSSSWHWKKPSAWRFPMKMPRNSAPCRTLSTT